MTKYTIETNYQDLQSQTLNIVRFPLIILVVFIHNQGIGDKLSDIYINWSNLSDIDYYNFIRLFTVQVIARIAVPAFFIISGFLFFFNVTFFDKNNYLIKLRKRFKTLFIPYVIWNVLATLPIYDLSLYFFKGIPLNLDHNLLEIFWNNSCDIWYDRFGFEHHLCYPLNVPLWYIRDLIMMVIVSPIIYHLIKNIPFLFFSLLTICGISGIWIDLIGFHYDAVLFFSLGAILGIRKINLVEFCSKIAKINYVITIITMIVLTYTLSTKNPSYGLKYFFYISCICSIVNLCSTFLQKRYIKPINILQKSTFFIYAYHNLPSSIILVAVTSLVYKLPISNICAFLLIPFIKVVYCLLIYSFLEKKCPKILGFITGSRS